MKSFQLRKKEEVNDFITNQKHSQFLQSWEWGEFYEKSGSEIFRLGVEDDGKLVMVATLIKKSLPMGKSYFYCPRGPIVNFEFRISNFESIFNLLISELTNQAENKDFIFLRLDPLFKIQNSKFKIHRTIDVQPRKTLILDLNKEEEEILNSMHQKTRYNIRLSHKKGVKVRDAGLEDFENWWKIMDETKERDQFRLHSNKYYKKMISIPFIKLVVAEYQDKIIAGNILSFFGDTCTYVHGASSNEFRNVMAPFALQWQTIQAAKKQGLKYYDFYGIDEEKWPGVTRFKKGFLPASRQDNRGEINYPGTFDMVFNNSKYIIYKLLRKIRRLF